MSLIKTNYHLPIRVSPENIDYAWLIVVYEAVKPNKVFINNQQRLIRREMKKENKVF